MPNYSFRNNETGEELDISMPMDEKETFLKNNPHLTQFYRRAPGIIDSMRSMTPGTKTTDNEFNSLLKHIKKGNSKGMTDSTIQTR